MIEDFYFDQCQFLFEYGDGYFSGYPNGNGFGNGVGRDSENNLFSVRWRFDQGEKPSCVYCNHLVQGRIIE